MSMCDEELPDLDDPCVVELNPENVICTDNTCIYPSKETWNTEDLIQIENIECGNELKFWHICYDCMMDIAPIEVGFN